MFAFRLDRGDDEGALLDLDKAVVLSGSAKGAYFLQRARARARVAMRSEGHEEALAGVQVGLDDLQYSADLVAHAPAIDG